MSIKEANITINIKDLDKSISFYESIGLTVKNRWGNHYAQLTVSGLVIGLHPTSDKNLTGGSNNKFYSNGKRTRDKGKSVDA